MVQLSGAVTEERQRQALRVAAENIPAIKKVEDYLTWVDPISGFCVEAPPVGKVNPHFGEKISVN